MNSGSLANGAVVANTAKAWPTVKRSILWDIANHGMRMDRASGTDLRVTEDDGRCGDMARGTNPDRPANDSVRPNGRRGIDRRQRVDNRGRMDAHRFPIEGRSERGEAGNGHFRPRDGLASNGAEFNDP